MLDYQYFSVLPIYCNICMTWEIVNNHINLSCKTDNLRFKILFLDYLQRDFAFCFVSIPKSICKAYYNNVGITQDLLLNETQLTIPLPKDNVNNVWTCRHGFNYEETTVEVAPSYKQGIVVCIKYICVLYISNKYENVFNFT